MSGLIDRIRVALDSGGATLPAGLAKEVREHTEGVVRAPNGVISVQIRSGDGTDLEKEPLPKGIEGELAHEFDEFGKYYDWIEWTIHSLGEPLYMDGIPRNLVVRINERSWQVTEDVGGREYEDVVFSGGGVLVFTPTGEPVTEGTWSAPEPGQRLMGAQIFGQPHFAQGNYFPSFDGTMAYLLWSRETYFGDCGQENMFIAIDDRGRPCRAWREWSCA